MKTLAERLKYKRTNEKLNQKQLAKLAGVTSSAISQWEREMTTPKGKNLVNLAKALNCSLEWLMGSESQCCEYIQIPFLNDVRVSAGHGYICDCDESTSISLPKKLFKYFNISSLVALPVTGDSMEPVLSDRAIIIMDSKDLKIKDGSMYVVNQNGLMRVKVLSVEKDGIKLKSYNRSYKDEIIVPDSEPFEVKGRVVWHSSVCI